MSTVLQTLHSQTPQKIIVELFSLQQSGTGVIITFLYFANLMKHNLMREESEFRSALLDSDYLLPDGIAMQMFYDRETTTGKKLHNCNGTDLIPAYLDRVYGLPDSSPWVGLLTVYDESIGKFSDDEEMIQQKRSERFGNKLSYFSHVHYKERNQEGAYSIDALLEQVAAVNSPHKVLILCTGTPHQELRAYKHAQQLRDAGMLVFCAGGLIDYIVGVEKRAPQWVVKARVLETFWRVATKPKKNLKKFLVMFEIIGFWWKKYVRRVETV